MNQPPILYSSANRANNVHQIITGRASQDKTENKILLEGQSIQGIKWNYLHQD